MADFSSKGMADGLRNIAAVLVEYDVVGDPSPLHAAASQLKTRGEEGDREEWCYIVSPAMPLIFQTTAVDYLNAFVQPRIYSTVELDSKRLDKDLPPFSRLDCALEILNEEDSRLLLRTHVDLANGEADVVQDGPLHHMQFGGHQPNGDRANEIAIKEPRWLHPPLDLILLCEIVVANFYAEKWEEIRQDPRWCDLIVGSQKICLEPYYRYITKFLSISSKTLLEQAWAKHWLAA